MKIEKIDNNKQKLIIISLIVSDKFCEKIVPILMENKSLIYQTFTDYYKIVLKWCIDYFIQYNKAIHSHIEDIFLDNKNKLNEEEFELIEKFLSHLSSKYEREENYNEDYVIDQSLKYLREVNLNILQNKINEAKKLDNIDEAENHIFSYNKLEKQTEIKQETFLMKDVDTAVKVCNFALNDDINDRLFKLPGDIGKKLSWIYREDFFSLVAPAKRGKSFYIREIALICCLEYNLKVIIFNLEMSHSKYLRNFYQNLAGDVKFLRDGKDREIVRIPYFEKRDNSDKMIIRYEKLEKKGLNGKKIRSIFKRKKISSRGEILIRSFPSNSLTFPKINQVLDESVLNGFVPDVVLFDFLDNIKNLNRGEFRHSIDFIWNSARRLAQEKHIAVGTVSHTSRKNFKQNLGQGDVNEDYRKENHITHMIGLNQTEDEKKQQITRLNILHNRDEDFNPGEFFVSLECRDIGKVLIDNLNERKVDKKCIE